MFLLKRRKIILLILLIAIVTLLSYFSYHLISILSKSNQITDLVNGYRPPPTQDDYDPHYDVIVIGGEPEGVAAAVSAARNGAKTLLIEKREELGGLMTYGMLNFIDFPEGKGGEIVSQGIFKEWHNLVGGLSAFDITAAKAAFYKLVSKEENLTLSTQTKVIEPIIQNQIVTGIKIKNPNRTVMIEADRFIDATQDADFAAASGVPYFIGNTDISTTQKKMCVTLMIHLKDVDWRGIKKAVKNETFGKAHIETSIPFFSERLPLVAWGFSDLTYKYEPIHKNTRLRGLNLVKVNNNYYINALQIFDVDGLSEDEKQKAIEIGKKETKNILNYLRENFPGFENAKIASFPNELYVRESRHIFAEYQLKASDVWENRDHWDSIAFGAYPIDVQAQSPDDYGYIIANPIQYGIPFRTLVPLKVDGLLVVGRSAGFSSIAAGSARIIPTGMATGEAAGAAAAISLTENISFREMSQSKQLIEKLRKTLTAQGAMVEHIELEFPYKDTWYYPKLKKLLNFGLVSGGYNNDLQIDESADKYKFVNTLLAIMKLGDEAFQEKYAQQIMDLNIYRYNEKNEPLTRDLAAKIIIELLAAENSSTDWENLSKMNIVDKTFKEKVKDNRVLSNSEMFYLLGLLLDYTEGSYHEKLKEIYLNKF